MSSLDKFCGFSFWQCSLQQERNYVILIVTQSCMCACKQSIPLWKEHHGPGGRINLDQSVEDHTHLVSQYIAWSTDHARFVQSMDCLCKVQIKCWFMLWVVQSMDCPDSWFAHNTCIHTSSMYWVYIYIYTYLYAGVYGIYTTAGAFDPPMYHRVYV